MPQDALVRWMQSGMATESSPFYEPHCAQAWETQHADGNGKKRKDAGEEAESDEEGPKKKRKPKAKAKAKGKK